ncbi:MAG: hypothetical protein WBF75_22295, partial [Pseudonocardiaceae bacterium]
AQSHRTPVAVHPGMDRVGQPVPVSGDRRRIETRTPIPDENMQGGGEGRSVSEIAREAPERYLAT